MNNSKSVAFGAVRIAPDGEALAWYRPCHDTDPHPWLVIREDPIALGVEHEWAAGADVAAWTDLQDPEVTRADDADQAAEAAREAETADPMPAGLAERVCQAMQGAVDGGAR